MHSVGAEFSGEAAAVTAGGNFEKYQCQGRTPDKRSQSFLGVGGKGISILKLPGDSNKQLALSTLAHCDE